MPCFKVISISHRGALYSFAVGVDGCTDIILNFDIYCLPIVTICYGDDKSKQFDACTLTFTVVPKI